MTIKCPKYHSENPETKQFCVDCRKRLGLIGAPEIGITKTVETPAEKLTQGTLFAGHTAICGEVFHRLCLT